MFFPFLDYITVDKTDTNEYPVIIYTTTYKCFVSVEIINTGGVEHYSFGVYAHQDFTGSPINSVTSLLRYTGPNSVGAFDEGYPGNNLNSFPSIIVSGSPIYLNRGSQYGTSTVRLHIFRLPESV